MQHDVSDANAVEFGLGDWLPSPETMRMELGRILASARFRSRPVLGRLLTHLIEALISHQTERLKEIIIAAEVFGRDRSGFDPQNDAIVRVTATRLRKQLTEYYDREQRNSELIIGIRSGSYVPHVRRRAASDAANERTIAVLPFRNLAPAFDIDSLCSGLTEELIDVLLRIPDLRVVSAESSFAFWRRGASPEDAARALGAAYLLRGGVQTQDAMIKISVRLEYARENSTLWSYTCLVHEKDLLQAQAAIAVDVLDTLIPHLHRAESGPQVDPRQRVLAARTYSPLARELQYRSRMLLRRLNIAQFERALELAKQAIQIEPEYAAAHWCAALACFYLHSAGLRSFAQSVPAARQFIADAVRLDPGSGVALALQAKIHYAIDLDWPAAASALDRAIRLEPHNASVLTSYAKFLSAQGRIDEALELLAHAGSVDPLNPELRCEIATVLLVGGRFQDALKLYREQLEIEPAMFPALAGSIVALLESGRLDEAEAEVSRFEESHRGHPFTVVVRGRLLSRQGKIAEARSKLEALARATPDAVSELDWAEHWVVAGDFDRAFAALWRAGERRHPGVFVLAVTPEFRPLHSDRRWRELLSNLHFPPSVVASFDRSGSLLAPPQTNATTPSARPDLP